MLNKKKGHKPVSFKSDIACLVVLKLRLVNFIVVLI